MENPIINELRNTIKNISECEQCVELVIDYLITTDKIDNVYKSELERYTKFNKINTKSIKYLANKSIDLNDDLGYSISNLIVNKNYKLAKKLIKLDKNYKIYLESDLIDKLNDESIDYYKFIIPKYINSKYLINLIIEDGRRLDIIEYINFFK